MPRKLPWLAQFITAFFECKVSFFAINRDGPITPQTAD